MDARNVRCCLCWFTCLGALNFLVALLIAYRTLTGWCTLLKSINLTKINACKRSCLKTYSSVYNNPAKCKISKHDTPNTITPLPFPAVQPCVLRVELTVGLSEIVLIE